MPVTLFNRGIYEASDLKVHDGHLVHVCHSTIARTDTSPKTIGTIPANATLIGATYGGIVGSNAGTTATISCGISGGSATAYISTANVKDTAGVGQYMPSTPKLGTVGTSDVVVTGVYAESGGASSTGGPFAVRLKYVTSATT